MIVYYIHCDGLGGSFVVSQMNNFIPILTQNEMAWIIPGTITDE